MLFRCWFVLFRYGQGRVDEETAWTWHERIACRWLEMDPTPCSRYAHFRLVAMRTYVCCGAQGETWEDHTRSEFEWRVVVRCWLYKPDEVSSRFVG